MHVLIYSTASNEAEAIALGRKIVEERLAACVNVIPGMKSCYFWKGDLEESSEAILIIKTLESLADEVTNRLEELHSYDLPAIIVLPIIGGSKSYLDWISSETSQRKKNEENNSVKKLNRGLC